MHCAHRIPASRGPLVAALLAAVGAAGLPAHAQSESRPASAGRIVKAFDFEERDFNPLPVPFGWIRAQNDPRVPRDRPGFPIWNGGKLNFTAPAYSGIGTVELPTEGGSTSLVLRTGELGVFPDADYMITARVRTDGLTHARARLVARLIDQQGNPITNSESVSELILSENHWSQLAVVVEGLSPEAVYMQIELELLQPEQQPRTHSIPKFMVWEQDFSGSAFFDDIVVAQLPRLELTTAKPGNIVLSNEPPVLEVLIRDLTGEQITANARVFDVQGNQVDSVVLSEGSRRVRRDWTPSLAKFGWYHADIEVFTKDELVGIRTLDFFWAPPTDRPENSRVFGIQADATRPAIADAIKPLVEGSAVGYAAINVWASDTKPEDFQPNGRILQTIDKLVRADIEVGIGFREVPIELADALAADTTAVLDVFASPMDRWNAFGGHLLDRYGQSTARWSFGGAPTEEPASKLETQTGRVHDEFSRFVPGPVISVPWSVERPLDPVVAQRARGVQLQNTGSSRSSSMRLLVEDWINAMTSAPSGADDQPVLSMVFRPASTEGEGFETDTWTAAGALARKALAFWWEAARSGYPIDQFQLLLADAWTLTPGKRAQVMPTPELHVWRTLSSRLSGRDAIEELDLLDGARVLLVGPRQGEPETEGVLIVWLEDPLLGEPELTLPLAMHELTRVDLFENETTIPLEIVGELDLPVHRVRVRRSPVIIEGVNIPLARFLSNIRLTPDTIEARSGIHNHDLVMTNPWSYPITGRLYIVEPGGYTQGAGKIDRSWEIAPRVVPFALKPGEVLRTPITLSFSAGELSGTKPLVFDVEVAADEQYPLMRMNRGIELGYDGVEIRSAARSLGDGAAEITVSVTNRTMLAQNLDLVAVPEREGRARASISGLEPGATATRRFVFRKTATADTVLIGLSVRDDDIRVNTTVTIP
ncbi:MAG: hypothetical protein KC996_11885 [Phycisphaerales bacterium]|nr:hypothetical protein [Phycisphaerales bacterium]